MNTQTFYITGTDTDAGKTWASVALIEAIKTHTQKKVLGMKPVASGCLETAEGLRNDDALKLQAAANVNIDYGKINPYALLEATAPEIAAARAGTALSLSTILNAYEHCAKHAEVLIVEGVGGWLAPLSTSTDQVDLVRALDCPVILVVGLKLGCINHARLTERALQTDKMNCVGWLAAETDPDLLFAEEYFNALQSHLETPCLGRLFAKQTHQLERVIHLIKSI
jgi:dethiobiotin synthetase